MNRYNNGSRGVAGIDQYMMATDNAIDAETGLP
jgi:hypothetical protein